MRTTILKLLFIFFIKLSFSQNIYFPPTTGNNWDTLHPTRLNYCAPQIDSLYAFLDTNDTKAFILLKDGKIVLEKYFDTHTQSTLWQWASAGKTITGLMIGVAQQEGLLKLSDTTSDIIGTGWTSCTPAQERKITIWNQITMTTGLDDGVSDNHCTLKSCLIYKANAGTRWAYHNAPYTLLDSVIEKATNKTLNSYTTLKLKTPTGMSGQFIKVGYNNVFFSNARSMARFGLLILNKGKWNNTAILSDTNFYNQMINTSQQLNKSYGYLWWLNGKSSYLVPQSQFIFNGPMFPNAPSETIAAIGKDGQFLNIVPSQNLVWLRMGNSTDGSSVPFLLNDRIWGYLNRLECGTTSVSEELNKNEIKVTTNTNKINVFCNGSKINNISIINLYGQKVAEQTTNESLIEIDMTGNSSGVYFVKITTSDTSVYIRKVSLSNL